MQMRSTRYNMALDFCWRRRRTSTNSIRTNKRSSSTVTSSSSSDRDVLLKQRWNAIVAAQKLWNSTNHDNGNDTQTDNDSKNHHCWKRLDIISKIPKRPCLPFPDDWDYCVTVCPFLREKNIYGASSLPSNKYSCGRASGVVDAMDLY
mmetsp:Transcript_29003/g.60649  ORF Transcript_29003/g.60649 Transcript_29003/m.60649 type:complete len:148 (-) Transcript_29003:823-1266(-)